MVSVGAADNFACARAEAQLLADVVKVAKQLAELAMVLCQWGLADRVLDAQRQLADDIALSRTRDAAACSRALREQQQRLTRIASGVDRVVEIFLATTLAAGATDNIRPILEIYGAAIAASPLFIGCDELTRLAETKVAAMRALDWDLAP